MSITGQQLVSVVTPVYNTEKYLAECIESVLKQTYENWEYIIVNNCSTDGSLKIAESYAQYEPRIRIHNNEEFLDVLQNLNNALRKISPRSKYCKMVLADDWLFPDCLERMVQVSEANPSVGIVGAYRLEEEKVTLQGLPFPSTVIGGKDRCRSFFLDDTHIFGSPTSLLIRSDFIKSRAKFYSESHLRGDQEVCFDILQNADFGFVHQVLTFTRRHNESISSHVKLFDTNILGLLIILKKYGSIYLTDDEYKQVMTKYMKTYYRVIARSIFRLRKKYYWDKRKQYYQYHRNTLSEIGYTFSWSKVCTSSLIVLYNFLLDKIKIK